MQFVCHCIFGHELSQHVGLYLLQAIDMQLFARNLPRDCSSYTLCGSLEDVSCHVTVLDQIYLSYTWEFNWFVSGYAMWLMCAAMVLTLVTESKEDGWQPPEINATKMQLTIHVNNNIKITEDSDDIRKSSRQKQETEIKTPGKSGRQEGIKPFSLEQQHFEARMGIFQRTGLRIWTFDLPYICFCFWYFFFLRLGEAWQSSRPIQNLGQNLDYKLCSNQQLLHDNASSNINNTYMLKYIQYGPENLLLTMSYVGKYLWTEAKFSGNWTLSWGSIWRRLMLPLKVNSIGGVTAH